MKSHNWFTGRLIITVLIVCVAAMGLMAFSPLQASQPTAPPALTLDVLAGLTGIILSLAFRYIPPLNDWYQTKNSVVKSYVMLGALAVVSLAIFGLSCANYGSQLNLPQVACSRNGAFDLIKLFVVALIANQSTYTITPAKDAKVAPDVPAA